MTIDDAKRARKKADNSPRASKKERVLHTRVPDVLEEQLKTMADNLKVPVSNVVRAILEDALEAADKATAATERGLRGWAERLHDERARLRDRLISGLAPATRADLPSEEVQAAHPSIAPDSSKDSADHDQRTARRVRVLKGASSLQPIVLLRDESCAVCLRAMKEGEDGWLVLRSAKATKKPLILGRECLPGARS